MRFRYPGRPYAETHPDRLAAAATFHGLTPASPDRCRVLEVGCGDGGNLVPMAYGLPASEFVGIDRRRRIETARAFALRVGVTMSQFEALDLMRFPQSAGAFDFIIAHGVIRRIPADVRDALIVRIEHHLAPHGVAFVSYNPLPGCHLRRMVLGEMLKFHTSELDDPESRLTEARALLHLVAHGNAVPDEYSLPLVAEAQRMEDGYRGCSSTTTCRR